MARGGGCNKNRLPQSLVTAPCRRVVRPGVLRVAPPHVAPHVGPAAAPESGEVGGDGDRPPRRRQQRELQRHAALGQTRRRDQAVECLRPRRGHRHRLGIVDRGPRARQRDLRRQRRIQPRARGPTAAGHAGWRSGRAGPVRRAATCRQAAARATPRRRRSAPRRTGRASRHRVRAARISATRAWNCRAASVQGSGRSPSAATARASAAATSAGSTGSVRSPRTSAPSRRRRRASTAPETGSKLVSTCSVMRVGRQRVGIERRGQPDARAGLQFQRGDRQQRRVGERIGARQPRPAAAGQPEAARLAAALRDAVGKRGGEQPAGIAIGGRVGAQPQPPAVLAGDAADARQRAAVGGRVAVRRSPPGAARYRPAHRRRATGRAPPAARRGRRPAPPRPASRLPASSPPAADARRALPCAVRRR